MELSVDKKYKFTATTGQFSQTVAGEFSGFDCEGGETVLRFYVYPWQRHQRIRSCDIIKIEEIPK